MIRALTEGFKFSKDKIILALISYLIITVIAFFSIFPWTGQFHSVLDNSIEAEKLLSNRWMPILLEELIRHKGCGIGSFIKFGITLRILFMLFSIFLSGGILACLYNKNKGSIKNLFISGWHYFHSLLWITFLSLIFLIPVTIVGGLIIAGFWQIMKNSESESTATVIMAGIGVVGVLFLMLFKMAGDYGRIQRVISNNETKAVREFLLKNTLHFITGIKFLFRNIFSIFGVSMLFFIIRVILIYCYLMYAPVITSGISLFISFIYLEIIIFVIVLLRISEMNAELSLTNSRRK